MRASGIILHISSLPSPYGVGTLGAAARQFADALARAGQSYWQVLPLQPTGFGDSPYQALSAFAGNPYFIDLDELAEENLLRPEELPAAPADPSRADYAALYRDRLSVLRLAYERFVRFPNQELVRFVTGELEWIRDYALFMALKKRFAGLDWTQWPEELRERKMSALREASNELRDEITFHYFLQYVFFRQWDRLKAYCADRGIRLIGDVPIYVPLDSADVWANPSLFQLDEHLAPTLVAGCPPDQFNEDGQLWGNPLYDWKAMAGAGYDWWLRRLRSAARMYDVVRLDHFRGFESYWAVPYGDKNARGGAWLPGPGMDFIRTVREALPEMSFIAEDLGFLTPAVLKLQKDSGFPGMKVLEFAFDPAEPSQYLPHRYDSGCVCYTGTHDNAPLTQWFGEISEEERAFAKKYLALTEEEGIAWGLIRGGMGSVAELFMAQMQDYLPAEYSARMNEPGRLNGLNWRWRLVPEALDETLIARIREITERYGRVKPPPENLPHPL